MRTHPWRCLALSFGLAATHAGAAQPPDGELVYFGTRGASSSSATAADQPNAPSGIYSARLNADTGALSSLTHVIQLDRAQWLVKHPTLPVIYAVANSSGGPNADSEIYSLAVDRRTGRLSVLNKRDSGGRDATHLTVDAASRTIFSANHGSDTGSPPPLVPGSLSALPLNPDGSLEAAASVQPESGAGPNLRRQRNAQAHCVLIDPSHKYVLVADLGADRIFIYRFVAATRGLTLVGAEPLLPGSGPRHMVFDPKGKFLYLNTELTAELYVFRWDAKLGLLHRLQKISAYPSDYAGKEEKSSSEVVVSRNGRFVYVSLRGDQNSIVVYAVDRTAGTLNEIQRVSSGGSGSRGFAIDPTGRWLLAANDSDSVTELEIDASTGELSPTQNSLSLPKPAAVLFYPR